MNKIGIIFDSRIKTGSGHLWRCLNLAKILKKEKNEFFFISNFLDKHFIKILKKENYNYIKTNSLNTFSNIKKIIKRFKLDVLISDYYDLSEKNKKEIKKIVKCFIVIDDHIDKKHNCDLFINNNFMTNKSKKKIKDLNPKSKLLLGPKYFISFNKFTRIQKRIIKKEQLKNIFAFFGSSDPTNETLKFVKSISDYKKIKFNILIGKINPNYKKIKEKCKNIRNIKLFYNLTNSETLHLIKKNDLSIGSGGINLTERLFSNLPSIVICTAKNQKDAVKALNNKKIIHFLGDHNKVSDKLIKKSIKKFLYNPRLIRLFSNKIYQNYANKLNIDSLKKELNNMINKKLKNA